MRPAEILTSVIGLATLSSAFPAAQSDLPVCGAGKTAVCADNQECHKIYCPPRPGSRVCKCVPQGQEPEDPFVAWGLPRTPHHVPGEHDDDLDCPWTLDIMPKGSSGCGDSEPKPHGYLPYDVPKPHHVPQPSSLPKPFGYPKYKNTTKPIPKPHHDPEPEWIPENPMIGEPRQRIPPQPRPHSYLPYDKPEPHAHPKPHSDDRPKEYSEEDECAALCSITELTGIRIPAWCDCVPPKPSSYPKPHHLPKPHSHPKPGPTEYDGDQDLCAALCYVTGFKEIPGHCDCSDSEPGSAPMWSPPVPDDDDESVKEVVCPILCHTKFPENEDGEIVQDWCACPVIRKGTDSNPHSAPAYPKPSNQPKEHPEPTDPVPGPKTSPVPPKEALCAVACLISGESSSSHGCECPPPKSHSTPVYPKPEEPDDVDIVKESICPTLCSINSIKFPENEDVEDIHDWCDCHDDKEGKGRPIYPLPHYPGEDGTKNKNDHYFD